eukprot:scaffold220909_cov60-Attheya_sp.AAC.1
MLVCSRSSVYCCCTRLASRASQQQQQQPQATRGELRKRSRSAPPGTAQPTTLKSVIKATGKRRKKGRMTMDGEGFANTLSLQWATSLSYHPTTDFHAGQNEVE